MALRPMEEKGVPLEKQRFTLRELSPQPMSKLDDDAMTRVRIILMNGIEQGADRFQHIAALCNESLREPLSRISRIEHSQQVMVNWLLAPDDSPLEITIGYEQVAIEVTAALAQHEPDDYLAQVYRFGLLEDFDHLYRYSALLDRLEGKDANNILQTYTDIMPGRPTHFQHRDPGDDLRDHYDRKSAQPLTKLNVCTLFNSEYQTRNYYMNIGPSYPDPVARGLYAEISLIEEQHITQYGSLMDPDESWLEKWLIFEAAEVYNYYSCMQYEGNPRIKKIWERCLDYELGHLQEVMRLFKDVERRDPAEILPAEIPDPINYESHREFVRQTLAQEVDYTADGHRIVPKDQVPSGNRSDQYRDHLNKDGSFTDIVAQDYTWRPGTEVANRQTFKQAS